MLNKFLLSVALLTTCFISIPSVKATNEEGKGLKKVIQKRLPRPNSHDKLDEALTDLSKSLKEVEGKENTSSFRRMSNDPIKRGMVPMSPVRDTVRNNLNKATQFPDIYQQIGNTTFSLPNAYLLEERELKTNPK